MLWCYRVCVPQYRAVGITRVVVGVSGRSGVSGRGDRSGRSMGEGANISCCTGTTSCQYSTTQRFTQVSMSASHRIYHILHTDNIQTPVPLLRKYE